MTIRFYHTVPHERLISIGRILLLSVTDNFSTLSVVAREYGRWLVLKIINQTRYIPLNIILYKASSAILDVYLYVKSGFLKSGYLQVCSSLGGNIAPSMNLSRHAYLRLGISLGVDQLLVGISPGVDHLLLGDISRCGPSLGGHISRRGQSLGMSQV